MSNQESHEHQENKKPKRMLKVSQLGDQTHVEINYSSLDLIQTCMRKAYYSLYCGYRSANESDALGFGKAMHKALECWYLSSPDERKLPSDFAAKGDLIIHGYLFDVSKGPLAAVREFYQSGHASIGSLPPDDKRSLTNGLKILGAYFRHYGTDGLTVYSDAQGPIVEREASHVVFESSTLKITLFGTIDIVLESKQAGTVMVTDHKTTAALGTEFYQRCKPNWQYCGYVYLAQKALGLKTNLFMINGIQVVKTKQEFARQVVEYSEDDFKDLLAALIFRCKSYIESIKAMAHFDEANQMRAWPMTAPGPCSNYGGCQYLTVCEVPHSIKQNVLDAKFIRQVQ